jgi:hypothetical protein
VAFFVFDIVRSGKGRTRAIPERGHSSAIANQRCPDVWGEVWDGKRKPLTD